MSLFVLDDIFARHIEMDICVIPGVCSTWRNESTKMTLMMPWFKIKNLEVQRGYLLAVV